jgi:hypothetical protein
MSTSWQQSSTWNSKFRRALDNAFVEADIELLTADYFAPEYRFSKVATPAWGKNFQGRLQELIDAARMNDWLLDLVAAARERRPKNPNLASLAEEVGLTITGPRINNPTGKPFEEIVQANARFINPVALREGLARLEGQVCWIQIPGGGGTGFLVSPDLVVTNAHVVERIQAGKARWQDVKCIFDYKQALDGTLLARKKQTEVGLDPAKWLVDQRQPSQYDWNPTLGDAGPGEIDCALLRLGEPVGNLPVGGDTIDAQAEPRGWIDVTAATPTLAAGHQIFLLQHPKGEPLQLAIGTINEFNNGGTRLRYDANSKDGSSGSPCLNADLQLVALHHAHDPAYPPKWNQAVPFQVIRQVWRDNGVPIT